MAADPLPVVDLTPATAEPPSLLQGVYQQIAAYEFADGITNYRTRNEET